MKTLIQHKYLITISLSIFTMVLLPTSCKDFMDIPPQGQISEEEIKNNPNAAYDLVNGVYNTMWLGGFDPDVHGFQYVVLTTIASDDANKGSTPGDFGPSLDVDNFTLNADNFCVDRIWSGYYLAIARANQALSKLPLSPLDDATKNRLIGEVRFLRGYFYFNLVRFFGGVPKITVVPKPEDANNDEFQTRASADEIYSLIIEDLTFAVDNLPIKGATQVGRATKAAAQSMLAKVYLYQENWTKVLELTQAVISGASGGYDLVKNYELIWRENPVNGDGGANNIESIFEVQTGKNTKCDGAINLYSNCQGPRQGGKGGWQDLGFGFVEPTEDLVNAYEADDVRKNATIIFITPTGTRLWDGFRIPSQDSVENKRYNYKAYHSRTLESFCGNNDRLPKNLRIMRFAEVLLMHAEASLHAGSAGDALTDINRIRERAKLTPLAAVTLNDVYKERRLELAMEHDRFFDIVRLGVAGTLLRAQGKSFVDGKNELFPIPNSQRRLSNNRLTQNPGYN